MKKKEETIVVSVRCIDTTAYDNDVDKTACAEYGEMVWLSSSWREKTVNKIICEHCFKKEKYQKLNYSANVTEECLNNAIELIRRHFDDKKKKKDIREEVIKIMEKKLDKKVNVIK